MPILGEAAINLTANTRPLSQALGRVGGMVRSAIAPLAAISLAIGASLGGIGIGTGIKLAADMEQAQVAFEVMLGSADEAKKLLAELDDFAASTPFQLPGIIDAGRKLLAFGSTAQDIPRELKAIGDLSAGIGAPIGEIAELYGKARVNGRLFMEDINQLTGRGIPIIGELAKQFGVADSEVRGLVSSGKVNFKNLEKAFQSLTSEGGKFAGLMEKQSNTTSGIFSTLKDNVSANLRELGQVLVEELNLKGLMKDWISSIQSMRSEIKPFATVTISVMKRVASAISGVVGTIAELIKKNKDMITGLAATAAVIGGLLIGIPKIAGALSGLIVVVKSVGLALIGLATSPIGIVIGAIGAAVAAFAFLMGKGETVTERLADGFGQLGKFIGSVFQNTTTVAATWSRFMDAIGEDMLGGWIRMAGGLERTFAKAFGFIQTGWQRMFLGMIEVWEDFKNFMKPATRGLASFFAGVFGKIQGLSDEEIQQHIDATLDDNLDAELADRNKKLNAFKKKLKADVSQSDAEIEVRIKTSLEEETDKLGQLQKIREQRDKEYIDKLANQNTTFLDEMDVLLGKLKDKLGLGDVMQEFQDAVAKARDESKIEDEDKSKSDVAVKASKDKPQFVGLQDMFKRIQGAVASKADEAAVKTAEHTKRTVEETKRNTDAVESGTAILKDALDKLQPNGFVA